MIAFPIVGAIAVATVAAVVDARTGRLPNAMVAIVAAVAVLAAISTTDPGPALVAASLGAVAFGAPLLLAHVVSPTSIGFGDVKLATALGIVIGPLDPRLCLVALCVATGTSSVAALATGRRSLPLGPGLVLGAVTVVSIAGGFGA